MNTTIPTPRYNKRGNQIIETGFRKFDKATNCISRGNTFANTQTSSFIRPYQETMCNGHTFEKGHLMRYDLEAMNAHDLPIRFREILEDKDRKQSYILYKFHVLDDIIGYVITDNHHHFIAKSYHQPIGRGNMQKRMACIDALIPYITFPGDAEIPSKVINEFQEDMGKPGNEYSCRVIYGQYEYGLYHHYRDPFLNNPVPRHDPYISVFDRADKWMRQIDEIPVCFDEAGKISIRGAK